jgi:ribonuclease Z
MLQLAGEEIEAVSVGGLETCIGLPRHKLCFDIGRGPRSAVAMSTVAFTHSHIDHMGGIAHHVATRALLGMGPPTYLVPAPVEAHFHGLLDAFRKIDGSELPCTVIPAHPGQDVPLPKGRFIRPFSAVHTLPALGYSLWRHHTTLRSELVGADQDTIRAARDRGEAVSIQAPIPLIAFSGDSRIEVLEREPVMRQAKLLIMEVTFLDQRVPVDKARENGHIHLDEVIQRADLFENEAILFTHLSARYRYEEALEILAQRLPDGLKERVHLLERPAWCP